MVAHVSTVAFNGIAVREVDVQVHIAAGLPTFTVVGLPDKAVAEAASKRAAPASGDSAAGATKALK